MKDLISLCGDNCTACPRYNAHTEEELRSVAELWHRVGWRDRVVSNDEIRCSGCSKDKACTYNLVQCTETHNVQRCNQCENFPCDTISKMLSKSAEYEETCKRLCTDAEYSVLSKAFFKKEKNLNRNVK